MGVPAVSLDPLHRLGPKLPSGCSFSWPAATDPTRSACRDGDGRGRLVASGRRDAGPRRHPRGRLRVPSRRDQDQPRPDPRSRWQPPGCTSCPAPTTRRASRWTDHAWTGRQLAGGVIYEMHVGTFTPEGTLDAAIGAARPPRRTGRRLRRGDAGQRVQRAAQLGLRRRAVVRGARRVRRSGGVSALRRRLPRPRSGGDPGRRLQPPRPERQLSARVRPVPARRGHQHLGRSRPTWTGSTPTRSGATSSTTP